MNLQSRVPTLLVVALLLLAAEIPLAWLVTARLKTDLTAAQSIRKRATA